VLTLVTRNNEGHLVYRSQSDNPLQGTALGGRTGDPRLSLAPAAGALRAGRRTSARASGAGRPARTAGAGDRTPAAERGGERGDVGCQSDRGVRQHRWRLRVAPSTVQRALRRAGLATRRQRLLVLEQRALQTAGLLSEPAAPSGRPSTASRGMWRPASPASWCVWTPSTSASSKASARPGRLGPAMRPARTEWPGCCRPHRRGTGRLPASGPASGLSPREHTIFGS
jgi:hypothetical protein